MSKQLPTLNSRLRVLVAKTFRAEKLYSSIRNIQREHPSNPAIFAEIANDIRSKEWQDAHKDFRLALNEILALGNSREQTLELARLKETISESAEESLSRLELSANSLKESAKSYEFAHAFRLSAELIKHKASVQARRVILEELSSVLNASGVTDDRLKNAGERLKNAGTSQTSEVETSEEVDSDTPHSPPASNVVSIYARGGNYARVGRRRR